MLSALPELGLGKARVPPDAGVPRLLPLRGGGAGRAAEPRRPAPDRVHALRPGELPGHQSVVEGAHAHPLLPLRDGLHGAEQGVLLEALGLSDTISGTLCATPHLTTRAIASQRLGCSRTKRSALPSANVRDVRCSKRHTDRCPCVLARGVLECLYIVGGAPPPPPPPGHPPPDQSDHRGKNRNLQSGKSCRAIFGTQTSRSQTPYPPLLILPWAWHCLRGGTYCRTPRTAFLHGPGGLGA